MKDSKYMKQYHFDMAFFQNSIKLRAIPALPSSISWSFCTTRSLSKCLLLFAQFMLHAFTWFSTWHTFMKYSSSQIQTDTLLSVFVKAIPCLTCRLCKDIFPAGVILDLGKFFGWHGSLHSHSPWDELKLHGIFFFGCKLVLFAWKTLPRQNFLNEYPKCTWSFI